MPYTIEPRDGKYIVRSPNHEWEHDTEDQAKRQIRLLEMIEHGKDLKREPR